MPEYLPKLEFNPYITPYAGSTAKEFDAFGQKVDARYEENVSKMDELDMLMQNVNVLNNDTNLKEKLLSDTRGQLKNITEKGDWENSRNHIREIAKRFKNDYTLNVAQANFKKAQELQAKTDEMKLRGETPIEFSNPNNFSTVGKDGKPRFFRADVEKQLDYRNDQATFFDQIKADSHSDASQNYGLSPKVDKDGKPIHVDENGNPIQFWENRASQKQWQGITNKKIIDQANRSIGTYLERPTGKQQLRVLMELQGLDYNQAKEVIRQQLIATGKENVYSQSGSSNTTSMIAPASQFKKQTGRTDADGNPIDDSPKYIIDKNTTLPDTDNSWGKTEFQDLWKEAFNTDTPNKQSKNKLFNILENLEDSKVKGVAEASKGFKNSLNQIQKLYGDKANQVITDIMTGGSSNDIPYLGKQDSSTKAKIQAAEELKKLRSKNIGLIIDSSFEDGVEDKANLKSARQVGWMKPNYNPEAGGMSSTQASAYDKTAEDVDLNNFNIIDGDSKKIEQLQKGNTKVKIKRVSNDVLGNGNGIGFLLEDKDGNNFIATPKESSYGNQLLGEMQSHLKANDLTFKDKFKNIPRFTQGDKYELGSIIENSEYADRFSEESIKQLKNIKIQKTPQGFITYKDGQVIKDQTGKVVIEDSPYNIIKKAFK